jgi:hypothetical protein
MRRTVLVCISLLVLGVPISCTGLSSGGEELETRVAELETQLAQAEAASTDSPVLAETANPPPTPMPADTQVSAPTPTESPAPIDTPTPEAPTATSPPAPTPTPTQPPLGTRANPVPRGQSRLAPDGWEVTVLDFNADAWPVVLAENQFNDPPVAGNRMIMVRVAVTNAAAEDEPAWISSADFYFVGSFNVLYSTFGEESWCGVIPDELAEELFRGGYAEGNVCFEIPIEETNLRLLYEYAWDDYTFFAVQ